MQESIFTIVFALCVGAVSSCRSTPGWSLEDALSAESIEMGIDEDGRPVEVEYHVSPDVVPARVIAAMEALHPGGQTIGAEKEFLDATLYWELSKSIEGREVEAMFLPNGQLHSEEMEVPAVKVPRAVQEAVQARFDGPATKWEEIRNGDRRLVEYHAKWTVDGKKYKVIVSTDGSVLGVLREVPAEIEVALP